MIKEMLEKMTNRFSLKRILIILLCFLLIVSYVILALVFSFSNEARNVVGLPPKESWPRFSEYKKKLRYLAKFLRVVKNTTLF